MPRLRIRWLTVQKRQKEWHHEGIQQAAKVFVDLLKCCLLDGNCCYRNPIVFGNDWHLYMDIMKRKQRVMERSAMLSAMHVIHITYTVIQMYYDVFCTLQKWPVPFLQSSPFLTSNPKTLSVAVVFIYIYIHTVYNSIPSGKQTWTWETLTIFQ